MSRFCISFDFSKERIPQPLKWRRRGCRRWLTCVRFIVVVVPTGPPVQDHIRAVGRCDHLSERLVLQRSPHLVRVSCVVGTSPHGCPSPPPPRRRKVQHTPQLADATVYVVPEADKVDFVEPSHGPIKVGLDQSLVDAVGRVALKHVPRVLSELVDSHHTR